MEPHIWTDVLHGANDMLEEGGILIMYDSATRCCGLVSGFGVELAP